jgi:glycosyltransferase involved in cell wall biosynthesis
MTKKVLHLIESSGPGGAETVLIKLVEALDRTKYRSVICLLKGGWLHGQLRTRGFETVIIPQPKGLSPGWIRRCVALLRQKEIDLLHAHEFTMNTYGSIVSRLTGIPIITTVHGKAYYGEKWRRRTAYRFAARQSKMVAVSEDIKNFLIDRVGIKSRDLITIRNGIDINAYSSAHSGDGKNGAYRSKCGSVIGTVGNLYPVKGQTYLLKAVAIAAQSFPEITCLIAGRGELLDTLQAEAARLGLGDRVDFLGFRQDIPQLLREMDIFVLPSLSEGLPLSALEAMAAGKPVVATDVGGTREAVLDGQTGFLVPPKDPQALSNKIMHLLRHRELARCFGQAGRKRVTQFFSLQTMTKRYEALYDEVSVAGPGH